MVKKLIKLYTLSFTSIFLSLTGWSIQKVIRKFNKLSDINGVEIFPRGIPSRVIPGEGLAPCCSGAVNAKAKLLKLLEAAHLRRFPRSIHTALTRSKLYKNATIKLKLLFIMYSNFWFINTKIGYQYVFPLRSQWFFFCFLGQRRFIEVSHIYLKYHTYMKM